MNLQVVRYPAGWLMALGFVVCSAAVDLGDRKRPSRSRFLQAKEVSRREPAPWQDRSRCG